MSTQPLSLIQLNNCLLRIIQFETFTTAADTLYINYYILPLPELHTQEILVFKKTICIAKT